MESLYRATGINHALIDNHSQVLTATGWEPVCTDYHRKNARTCERCKASDRHILSHLKDAPYVGYECPNGLIDYAVPVIIGGEHVANVFTGQIFHSPPKLDFFHRQADEFGFDKDPYLQAVQQVRVVPRDRMPEILAFLVDMAETLGQQGLTRLRQLEAEQELRQLNNDLSRRVLEATKELREKNQRLSLEIVKHEQAEAALHEAKQFSDDIINSLPGIFYMLDTEGRFERWNSKFNEVSGYGPAEMLHIRALDLFDRENAPIIQERMLEVFEQGESCVEAPLLTKDGRLIPHYFNGRRRIIGNKPYLVGLGIDISDRKALEIELERRANEDSLTGMATRRHFFGLAERELAGSRRYGYSLSFLMLDIDKFKEINDCHGHGVGDEVLRQFTRVCRATLREVDIVGRLGGDEFAILLPGTDIHRALRVGERLRQSVAAMPIKCDGDAPLCFTVSIGAATLENLEDSIDVLFKRADEALYRAKNQGRNWVTV